MLPGLALVGIGIAIGGVGYALSAVGVVVVLVGAVIVSALSGIYRTALYHFAAHGQVPGVFADLNLHDAFRPRRGQRGGFGQPSTN
jgi:hypothetical protein